MQSKIIYFLGGSLFTVMTFCDANGMNDQELPTEVQAIRLAPESNNDHDTTPQASDRCEGLRWNNNDDLAKWVLEGWEQELELKKKKLQEIIDQGKTLERKDLETMVEDLNNQVNKLLRK